MKNENKNTPTLEDLAVELETARKAYEFIKNKYAKQEKEEAEARRVKLASEKESRYKEVIAAYDNFEELMNSFVEDYGKFTFHRAGSNLADFLADFWN